MLHFPVARTASGAMSDDSGWLNSVARTRNADRLSILGANVTLENVFTANAALSLVEGALDRCVLEVRLRLDLEQHVIGLFVNPLQDFFLGLNRNLGRLHPLLPICEELEFPHCIDEIGLQGETDRALLRMVEDCGQFAVEGLGHQNLAIGGAGSHLDAVHQAGLGVAFTEFGEDEKSMVFLALDTELLHCKAAHSVAQRHEWTLVAVKFKSPFRGDVLGGHDALLEKCC